MSFLRLDRDYRADGGLWTVSATNVDLFHQFQAFQSANPHNPMRFDIPDRDTIRGKCKIVKLYHGAVFLKPLTFTKVAVILVKEGIQLHR